MLQNNKGKQAGSRDVMQAIETLLSSYPTPMNSTLKASEETTIKSGVSAYNTRTKRDDAALSLVVKKNKV